MARATGQPGAPEAIACYREHHHEVDLVTIDLTMQVMNGRHRLQG